VNDFRLINQQIGDRATRVLELNREIHELQYERRFYYQDQALIDEKKAETARLSTNVRILEKFGAVGEQVIRNSFGADGFTDVIVIQSQSEWHDRFYAHMLWNKGRRFEAAQEFVPIEYVSVEILKRSIPAVRKSQVYIGALELGRIVCFLGFDKSLNTLFLRLHPGQSTLPLRVIWDQGYIQGAIVNE
jgi:hypothetical protein